MFDDIKTAFFVKASWMFDNIKIKFLVKVFCADELR